MAASSSSKSHARTGDNAWQKMPKVVGVTLVGRCMCLARRFTHTRATNLEPVRAHAYPSQNGEFFALTYGAMVMQLVKDYEDVEEVNTQLERIG